MRYQTGTKDWIFVTDEEAYAILKNIRPEHWLLPVKLLFHYGLRVSEVLGLTSENFLDGEMVIQRLKGGRLTRQYILPELKPELDARIAAHAPGTRIFPHARYSLYRIVQQAGNRAGVNPLKAHPHSFRHRAGRVWSRIAPIQEVSAMMGHSCIQTTMKYARLECDVSLSRKFLERL